MSDRSFYMQEDVVCLKLNKSLQITVNNLTGLKLQDGVKLTNSQKIKAEISSWLSDNNIKPTQRPETLAVSNWVNLTKSFQ